MAQHIKPPVLKAGITNSSVNIGDLFSSDRAQSRFFTVTLDKMDLLKSSNIVNGDIEGLPVKNISYTISSIDIMSLPIGVFRDMPIPVGKNLPKITLTLIDDRMDQIETDLRIWNDDMIPSGTGQVGYLDDMVGTLVYKSYDTCGDLNFTYQASVILTGDISLTRDYESNELKVIEISLIVLKDEVRVTNAYNKLRTPEPIPVIQKVIENNNTNNNLQTPVEGNFNLESTVQPIFNFQ